MTVGIEFLTGTWPQANKALHFREAPFRDALPSPLYFRSADMPDNATYPRHSHPWGEFVYSYSGVIEISLADRHYLAPPQYGVWLPPDVEHQGFNRHAACHCSLYVSPELCGPMPETTTALEISPLLRSMLEHLRMNGNSREMPSQHQRFLQVVIDLLATARRTGTYLPWSEDSHLQPILSHLEESPQDNRALAEFARLGGTTERTLIRRCMRDLGIPFAEWKQRLRVIKAMPLLEGSDTIERISTAMGYGSASAFIAMFKRMTGMTPEEYRASAR